MSRGAAVLSTIRSGHRTLAQRRVEAAVLIASLLLSSAAVAPSRTTLASTSNGAGGKIWYVASYGTDGSGSGCSSADFGPDGRGGAAGAIQTAVGAASSGDTIVLCNGTHRLTASIDVTAKSGLTFKGESTAGTEVSGGSSVRLFDGGAESASADVTFIGLTLRNGWGSDGNGGAVRARNVSVVGAVVRDNSTYQSSGAAGYNGGGAIYAEGSVSAVDSTFTNNLAAGNGNYGGGAILSMSGSVTISGGTYADNATECAGGGGAVYARGPISVTDATFSRNGAPNPSGYGGGAIVASGSVTITRGVFTDNSTGGYSGGGAIYSGDSIEVSDASFVGNGTASSGSYGGGALYAEGTVQVTGGVLADNTTAGSYGGGAIYANASVSVTDATFASNAVTNVGSYGGGAIISFYGLVSTRRSTFVGNTATTGAKFGGGAINAWYGDVAVDASTFDRNAAGTGVGGAIVSGEGSVRVVDSTFVENTAGVGGGAIQARRVEVTNGTFVDNSAAAGGHIRTVSGFYVGSMTAGDTIFAGGTCVGAMTSIGTNLTTDASCPGEVTSGTALALLPLADYGGPTSTIALGKGSVARDATTGIAGDGICLTTVDQRGEVRPYNGTCDIGAFEGPVPAGGATIAFAGAYWVKSSGTATVPLTALVTPAVAGCTVTFSVSDGTNTYGPFVATTDTSTDTTTATLRAGTYSVSLAGSGGCDGTTATGTFAIGSGQSRAGTSGSGDYTAGSAVVVVSHSLSVTTEPNRRGGGTTTSASGSLTWTADKTWRITATVASGSTDGTSAWLRVPCPDGLQGAGPTAPATGSRPAACGTFTATGTLEEWTTGTRGRKLDWVTRGPVTLRVTVWDGGTSCTLVGRKQVCTSYPDWFGLEVLGGWSETRYGLGTTTRLRTGSIAVD